MPPKKSSRSRRQQYVASPVTASPLLPVSPVDIQTALQNRADARARRLKEKTEGSAALKQEANVFFKNADYAKAIDKYEEANDKYGKSLDICCNLALAYRKIGFPQRAADAATDALKIDPKSLKARYRRGVARAELRLWNSAFVDFETVISNDPTCTEASVALRKAVASQTEEDGSDHLSDKDSDADGDESESEWPHYDRPPAASEVESDSSDCKHKGNGKPCHFYNHEGCARGETCKLSHAPDGKSLRDGLGRNVCLTYILGLCPFEDHNCAYLHDTQYLPKDSGWWNHDEQLQFLKQAMRDIPADQCNKDMLHGVLSVHHTSSPPPLPSGQDSEPQITYDFTLPPSEGLPYVLLLSLEHQISVFQDAYSSLKSTLSKRATLVQATTIEQALGCLTNCSEKLAGVLVTDHGIAHRRHRNVLSHLVRYTKAGGRVVLGGHFITRVNVPTMELFWKEGWGLPFKMTHYHRETFVRNPNHETVKANPSLPSTYNVKASHLGDVPSSSVLYGSTGGSWAQPPGSPPSRIDSNDAPIVYHRFGQGYVGFIGDANGEDDSTTIALAMLNLLDSKIRIAIFQLSDRQVGLFHAIHGTLVETLSTKADVQVVRTNQQALDILANWQDTDGIFIADSEPVEMQDDSAIAAFLAEYTRRGGIVIFGGLFPAVVERKKIGPFFERWWKVQWDVGSFTSITPVVNPKHELSEKKVSLPKVGDMRALSLANMSPTSAVYKASQRKNAESPVLRAQVGKGRLCWIGDVEGGDNYNQIVLGLFDKLNLD